MAKPLTDTGWQQPTIVGGKAILANPTGTEEKPCFTCKSWEKDERKLIEFLVSRGMKAKPNGCYDMAVIAGDLPDRKQIEIDPKDFGFCRQLCMPTHMMATCECWKQRLFAADMRGIAR